MNNPWLQKLLTSVVDDPDIAPRLKRAPAAMTMHHAYLGGLLEHVVSLIGLGLILIGLPVYLIWSKRDRVREADDRVQNREQ